MLLVAQFVAAACLAGSPAGTAPAVAAESGSTPKQSPKTRPTAPAAKPNADTPPVKSGSKPVADPIGGTAKPQPAAPGKQSSRPVPVPQGCADLTGVQRQICVECDGVALHMRVVCHQRVFWTACKGKRLLEDAYCQSLQDGGRPPGEGG